MNRNFKPETFCFICSQEWPVSQWIKLDRGRVVCSTKCGEAYLLCRDLNLLGPETKPKEKVDI